MHAGSQKQNQIFFKMCTASSHAKKSLLKSSNRLWVYVVVVGVFVFVLFFLNLALTT